MPEEIRAEVVQKTQKQLGKYVKKPQLTEKLLKKPPFRFLHDVINVVIRETGFLKGLFTEDELNSDNVKERDAKVAFLTKLIDALKSITGTELAARPSKIVAGLEPTDTNILLQTLASALDKKLDSSNYVNNLHSTNVVIDNKKPKTKTKHDEKPTKRPSKTDTKIESTPRSKRDTPKSTDRKASREKINENAKSKEKLGENTVKSKKKEPKSTTRKEEIKEKQSLGPKEPEETIDKPVQPVPEVQTIEKVEQITTSTEPTQSDEDRNVPIPTEDEIVKKRPTSVTRPKSARPKSGGDSKEKTIEAVPRPPTSLRPPSVRPSSARPGAPRLRPESAMPLEEVVPMGKINVIVENFDVSQDEEETVVIHSTEEIQENRDDPVSIPDGNKGHLVEQILEQINEGHGEGTKVKTEIDWQLENSHNKETSKEIAQLCSTIQSMTKSANPLGKLLNYLHEDIDAMQVELQMWSNMKRQLYTDIARQKKTSLELNKPLITQLENINREITKVEEEIAQTRSNILRKEAKIEELLTK